MHDHKEVAVSYNKEKVSAMHHGSTKQHKGLQGTTTNNCKGPRSTAMDYYKYVRSD